MKDKRHLIKTRSLINAVQQILLEVKIDHHGKFSNLSNWKAIGIASHRYCGGHRFESRWSPDFFRFHLSNCLNWKIYCDDQSSLHLQPQYKCELFHIYFTSVHLISLSPIKSSLYRSISCATWAAFLTVYIVSMFQHPTHILDFGVANDLVSLWASHRLLHIGVMLCPAVCPSMGTASPLLISSWQVTVSVIFWIFRGQVIGPLPNPHNLEVQWFFCQGFPSLRLFIWLPSRCCFSLGPHRKDQSGIVRPARSTRLLPA